MKKSNLKSILGTAIVLSTLTNVNAKAEIPKKVKNSKSTSGIVFKIQDRTNDQSSVSDGSKTEKASK